LSERGSEPAGRADRPGPADPEGESAFPPRTPYYLFLGLQVAERSGGRALVRLPHRPDLTNSRGEIHGGAQGSLLDVAMSQALRSVLPPGSKVATISLTVNHLAAGHGSLVAHGRVIKAGRSVATVEGYIEDAQGAKVAWGLGTFRVWRRAEPGKS
jgi:uncharacterized protein (TIGR00369 family)